MKVHGTVRVPGDKSISHRSLICASLASGVSRIGGILEADDVKSTAGVMRSLGVSIPRLSPTIEVEGVGLGGLRKSNLALQCGNSGTTARLIAGVVAACPFLSRLEGDSSLSRRPMMRVAEPLRAMGARIEFDREDGLPMTIDGGSLAGIAWNTRAASAQTKSAILFAGLVGGVAVSVRELRQSRDHTERMLSSLGVPIDVSSNSVSLSPVPILDPLHIDVPGDPSSAAFPAAVAVLASRGKIRIANVCVNETRTGFFRALIEMGASIQFDDERSEGGEPVATIIVKPAALRPAKIVAEQVPSMIDELPLLACVAAGAGVGLDVSGAEELRVKESDRISALVSNLKAIGVDAEEKRDGFRIIAHGKRALRGEVTAHSDHRIAMAFGVLSYVPGNRIEIDDRECVSISYPSFWKDVESLIE